MRTIRRTTAVRLTLVACWALPGSQAAAQPAFVLGGDAAGIQHAHILNGNTRYSRLFGAGVAAGDYDRDGRIDLFLCQAYGFPDALYRNNGDGTFSELAAAAGVDGLKEARAAIWLDYDNDHWLDLFVACDPDALPGVPIADPNTTANLLYHNDGDGSFTEVSLAAGVRFMPNPQTDQTTAGVAAADINNDGWLDVYVS
ncbi:MAG: VCBS repeat-containing protein, partial [Planctomycetota bacterium]